MKMTSFVTMLAAVPCRARSRIQAFERNHSARTWKVGSGSHINVNWHHNPRANCGINQNLEKNSPRACCPLT